MASSTVGDESPISEPPAMWMLYLRIKKSATYPFKDEVFIVTGETETRAPVEVQLILAKSNEISEYAWPIQGNENPRSVPPPLTIEMPDIKAKYVLELEDGLVQWFKETLEVTGKPLRPNHWVYHRALVYSSVGVMWLLNSIQEYFFPISSIFHGKDCSIVHIITNQISRRETGECIYEYTKHWATTDTTLGDVFEALVGDKVNDSFAFREGLWDKGGLRRLMKGPLHTYRDARKEYKTLGELGWKSNVVVWFIPRLLAPGEVGGEGKS